MKFFSIVIKLGISKLITLHVLLWVNNAFVILLLYIFYGFYICKTIFLKIYILLSIFLVRWGYFGVNNLFFTYFGPKHLIYILINYKNKQYIKQKKKNSPKTTKKKLNQEKKIYLDPDMFFKSRWDSKQPSSNSHYRMESVEHNNDKFYR